MFFWFGFWFASEKRRPVEPVHRTLTSPPSSWPDRELRKYHYPLHLSSPAGNNPVFAEQPGSLAPKKEVMACFLPWLGASAPMQRTYFSDSGIFNCQGTMKGSLYFTLLLTSQREGRKYSIFHKKVHFLCFAQRVCPDNRRCIPGLY